MHILETGTGRTRDDKTVSRAGLTDHLTDHLATLLPMFVNNSQ